jgi:hypothetical protein
MDVPLTEAITAEHIDTAKQRLILARATHLDSLVARLHEPRVRRILEPLIAGEVHSPDTTFNDDLSYVRDLGLIAGDRPIRIANPIYREVIVRVLGTVTEESVTAEPRSFVLPDGRCGARGAPIPSPRASASWTTTSAACTSTRACSSSSTVARTPSPSTSGSGSTPPKPRAGGGPLFSVLDPPP